MIVGLTGKARSGKDTTADYLVSEYGFKKITIADKLKEIVNKSFLSQLKVTDDNKDLLFKDVLFLPRTFKKVMNNVGVDGENFEIIEKKMYDYLNKFNYNVSPRQLYQFFGTDCIRELYNEDFWVEIALEEVNPKKNYVISDVRFDNEVSFLDKLNVIDVETYIVETYKSDIEIVNSHSSENGLDEDSIDFVLVNDSSKDDLYNNIDNLLPLLDRTFYE